jgi:NHL repeat
MTIALAAVLVLVGGMATAHAAPKSIVGVVGAFTDQSGTGAGEFAQAAGVAVNQGSGEVYVVDAGNDRVQRFAADGPFISQFGVCGAADGEFGWACFGAETIAGIAVGPDGSVYVADNGNQRIQQFSADGTFVRAWGTGGADAGQFSNPVAVAVDPADGDVLVADRDNNRVQRFSSTGVYESQFAVDAPHRVAVDSTGAIYVLQLDSQVQEFDQAGVPVGAFASEDDANVGPPSELATAGDRVFVARMSNGGPVVLEYDPALASGDQLVDTHTMENLGANVRFIKGLAARSGDGPVYVNLELENAEGGVFNRVFILDDTGVPSAIATPFDATNVEATTATLNGEIDSNGGLPTNYRLEISPDGADWTTAATGSVPGGATEVVSADVGGLRPNTLYRFRIVTDKGFGSPDVASSEIAFLTKAAPPEIVEFGVTSVDAASATLQGRINPHSSDTRYRFEYGIGAFDSSIPVPDAQIGSGPNPVFVSHAVQDLVPGATYQFRLVARSPAGVTTGPTKTFTTPSAFVPPDHRAYELVSPADKVSGVGAGNWYAHPAAVAVAGVPAHERERFAVQGTQGATLSDDGAYSFANDWVFAERTPEGWRSRPAISRRAHGPQLYTFAVLHAANEDLSLTSWSSNGHILRLFPELESWDDSVAMVKPLRRWTEDGWEIFDWIHPDERVLVSGRPQLADGPTAIAADGSALAASGDGVRGLAGPRDPTGPPFNELQAGQSVYLDEITGPFSDVFPGDDRRRELVNVCTGTGPERTLLPSGPCAESPDRDTLISAGGASLSPTTTPVRGRVMSDDGSRVFFMSPDPAVSLPGGDDAVTDAQLYVRQRNADGSVVTRWISRSKVSGQASSLIDPALFEGASRDGDKVFFRTTAPLTADDPNGTCGAPCTAGVPDPDSADLYMYDLPAGDDPAGGDLVRVSAGPGGDGDCNSPEAADPDDFGRVGALRFVSDDGGRVYFTCAAPLPGVPDAANGTVTSPGGSATSDDASNLYVYDATEPVAQRWRFVDRVDAGRDGECRGTRRFVAGELRERYLGWVLRHLLLRRTLDSQRPGCGERRRVRL